MSRTPANRRFARVAERIPVRYRTLDPAAAQRASREIALGGGRATVSGLPPDPPVDAAHAWDRAVLTQVLARLDRLEEAVGRLTSGGIETAASWVAVETTCLSGGGLALESRPALPQGTILELEIDLPGATAGPIRALGRVVGGAAADSVGIAFDAIAEVDREQIVRFSFRSQRAHLRERRR